MILIHIIKYFVLLIINLNSLLLDKEPEIVLNNNSTKFGQYSFSSLATNISNIPEIYLGIEDINFTYSKKYNLIEMIYFINIFDQNYHLIKPSDLPILYNLGILCDLYNFKTNENIYSIANIFENRCFYCIEYSNIGDHSKYGIKIYNIKEIVEEIEYNELFFFTDKIINIDKSPFIQKYYKFDINFIYKKYNQFLSKINNYKTGRIFLNESNNLIFSYLQPPLCLLKRNIAMVEGKWYFNNIYENYFCFCKGESCLNIITYNSFVFQSCKYYFYLTIINNNKYLYPKTDYFLSDFFDENIESSEAFPVFKEMLKNNLKAHYITMSWNIYRKFCLRSKKCKKDLEIIYGIRKIDGDVLEKYLELFLKLKVVIAAEKYDCIDNLFYNIDYIIYIFFGHGVTYIKSYLYNDYLSPNRYNKILLPPSVRFISLALKAGWKYEDIIKIGYPKWDNYEIHKKKIIQNENQEIKERSIFLMFTWRKTKKGKKMSNLYYENINNLLNNTEINEQLYINNVKFYFCYHHSLKDKKIIDIDNDNIKLISQNEISILLKNSSLIITDFSSILFDAIVQRKPLILFIPDGLDPNLNDIYIKEYSETIRNIKDGIIYLYEVFFSLTEVVNKIIYYIKNNFDLEKEKLKFYKKFRLKNRGNTRKFINYLKRIN